MRGREGGLFYQIKQVRAVKGRFGVLLHSGTSFEIVRPNFGDINDTMRFQYELLNRGIHFVEVQELMFTLVIGLLHAPSVEVYHRA